MKTKYLLNLLCCVVFGIAHAQHLQNTIKELPVELNYTSYHSKAITANGTTKYFAAWTKNQNTFSLQFVTEQGKQYIRAEIKGKKHELSFASVGASKLGYNRLFAIWSPKLNETSITTKNTSDGQLFIRTQIKGKAYELSWASLFVDGNKDPYKRKSAVWTPTLNKSSIRYKQPKPVNHYTYLGSHNSVASYAYGYTAQNSQRYSVTTQLNGGVRALEIDVVDDNPNDKYEKGVYICHCGQAPHSYSKSELKRAKEGDFLSKIPLPLWSHGALFGRFNKVLKEIDEWLIAHPNEIVFLNIQKNNVTAQPFEKEVNLAQLKTGVYVETDALGTRHWPTRSELIQQNKRIIFLNAPIGKYATKRHNTFWHGNMKPAIYGKSKIKGPIPGDDYGFTEVANNSTSPTDAITARFYNDYEAMKKRITEWNNAQNKRAPSIIYVNQSQIANPIKVINEINGSDYQVKSNLPYDPKGDWIVNASADIGNWFYNSGVDIGAWTKDAVTDIEDTLTNWIEGQKTSDETIKSITFNNQGGYVAHMMVTYIEDKIINGQKIPIPKNEFTDKISLGFSRTIELSKTIRPESKITVIILGIGTFSKEVYKTTITLPFSGNKCFKSWGTIFDAKGAPCN